MSCSVHGLVRLERRGLATAGVGTERHPNADLLGAFTHRERDDGVDTYCCEDQREGRETTRIPSS